MPNILDYLDWRGDLPFVIAPFNKVDNLILSQLSYVNFNNIIPGIMNDDYILMKDAGKLYMEANPLEKMKKGDVEAIGRYNLIEKLSLSRRYKNAKLLNYISILDEKNEKQFSAMCIQLGDNSMYVAFRGTDDTITGWKEDFNMTLAMPVPSQLEAVNYLNIVGSENNMKLRVGGHSKGGNLAIYAAINCEDDIKMRIRKIYNNDGPGFTQDIIDSNEYQSLLNKIITIVPEYSLFGLMFEHRECYMIVKSSENGIMQHDPLSWQVIGNDFKYVQTVCKGSMVLNTSLTNWINSLTDEEKYNFIEVIYKVIKSSGCTSVSDFRNSTVKYAPAVLKEYSSLDSNTKDMAIKALRILNREYGKNLISNIRPHHLSRNKNHEEDKTFILKNNN